MPSAQASPGSLTLGYCCAMNQALCIPIAFFITSCITNVLASTKTNTEIIRAMSSADSVYYYI